MSNIKYPPGMYLVTQKSNYKLVTHYGILDIGNRLNLPIKNKNTPIIIHQVQPRIRFEKLKNIDEWYIQGKITNEYIAIMRINKALNNPKYSLFGNNCEHFARYVATGKKESIQLQFAFTVITIAALAAIKNK